jgi:signal transduction histidine kinase
MTRRLLLGLMAFAAVVLALLVIPLGVANQRSERADLTRRIEHDAVAAAALADELLRSRALDSDTDAQRADLTDRLEAYARDSDARVVVVDAAGSSVVDTGEPGEEPELGRDFTTRPEIASALAGRVDSGQRGSDTLGHDLLFVAVPVTSGGASLGAVRVSFPSHELDERVRGYWTVLAAVSLAVLGVAALAAILLAGWIARPLDAIAGVARAVSAGELGARADADAGPPEVRLVAERLNASLDAVQGLVEEQRRFTADASHQLRTPLHALTLRLENASLELEQGDAAAATLDVEHAASEVERLAGLVEALLVLERADRLDPASLGQVDLREVVAARADAWSERAARAGVTLEHDVPAGLVALAHRVHVEQVLDNYVDNAIAVTPDGRAVRIAGRSTDEGVELHVVDEGPGLADADIEAVFQRFRTGADQPRPAGGGGFGLGLAIVRRLAELDGGTAWLRHGPGRGIDAVVRYRAAPSASDGH